MLTSVPNKENDSETRSENENISELESQKQKKARNREASKGYRIRKKAKSEILQKEYNALRAKLNALEGENAILREKFNGLKGENADLRVNLDGLKKERVYYINENFKLKIIIKEKSEIISRLLPAAPPAPGSQPILPGFQQYQQSALPQNTPPPTQIAQTNENIYCCLAPEYR